jgi:hypothetical protein
MTKRFVKRVTLFLAHCNKLLLNVGLFQKQQIMISVEGSLAMSLGNLFGIKCK